MENFKNIKQLHTKILIPVDMHDIVSDLRLLIPFTNGDKIGFMNNQGMIIVKPQYTMYYGECYSENDLIRVSIIDTYGFPKSGGNVSTYQRPLYGLINYKGEVLLEPVFYTMISAIGNKRLFTVQNKRYEYGVITADGEEIVPFGKYQWIDGFDKGLARVKLGKVTNGIKDSGNKWGLIDVDGNEVLPVEYDDIWNFYARNRITTKIIKDKKSIDFKLSAFKIDNEFEHCIYNKDDYRPHYGEFEGSYAQDVMGYSDDVINDAFEGDPDNYWNID